MLLAPRALGLGATLTTLYLQFENEAEAVLGLPASVHSYALLPRLPDGTVWACPPFRSSMWSMKIGGVRLTGICSDLVAFTRRCLSGRTDRLASVILNVRGRS